MAGSSFDIVCEVNLQEVDNAVNQSQREVSTRYDFKGSPCEFALDKSVPSITITASDELKLATAIDILLTKLLKRSVPVKSLVYGKTEPTGRVLKKKITVQQGLDKEQCKQITQFVKDMKIKAQAQVMGEQVRVTAKSIDLLQQVIAELKAKEFDFDMQFSNYR
ncbi:YajQ family cyclic di-GMP-binding protein [Deltaproteobacteria bacterium TL4]